MERKKYLLDIKVNGRFLTSVIIDQHYKEKHPDVTDEVILDLVLQINGFNFDVESEEDGFQYFRVEPVFYKDAPYRLILLLCVTEDFLGVINAFRVKE